LFHTTQAATQISPAVCQLFKTLDSVTLTGDITDPIRKPKEKERLK
jgi:hypothetical protein